MILIIKITILNIFTEFIEGKFCNQIIIFLIVIFYNDFNNENYYIKYVYWIYWRKILQNFCKIKIVGRDFPKKKIFILKYILQNIFYSVENLARLFLISYTKVYIGEGFEGPGKNTVNKEGY